MEKEQCKDAMRYVEGPEDADVMLVGQNPGADEVRHERPFVGRAGKYLDKVLEENDLDRRAMYITQVVREPTPKNRKPHRDEIDRWMPCLVREMERIRPGIVVLMGAVAWEAPRLAGIEYLEIYHPAAAMRFPDIREKFEKDVARLADMMRDRKLKGAG
ncbi:MAG: uracil-DNA glycosylase [Desulfatibacillaceae bacterium]